jgi:hypothetical protein
MPRRERIPLILRGYAPCGGVAAKDIGNKFPGKSETFRTSGRQSRLTWREWASRLRRKSKSFFFSLRLKAIEILKFLSTDIGYFKILSL